MRHRLLPFLLLPLLLGGPARADGVTKWTALADRLGYGGANWRTLAIMHQAMHDAWNAAQPRYARWFPPEAGEPAPNGAKPEAAMDVAALRVLLELHPDDAATIRAASVQVDAASAALGEAVALAAVRRRAMDGYEKRHPFPPTTGPGRWRPAPTEFSSSNTTETRPFLFASEAENPAVAPPAPGTPQYQRELAETLRLGGGDSTERTDAQTDAAIFWAYQSSQRGFVALGAALLEAHPRPEGLAAHARIMSQLTVAMADSAILTWFEKERFSNWRPISGIRETVPGESDWAPLIPTPPHPEYPSGHASDCFVGAYTLAAAMPDIGAVTYVVQLGAPPDDNVGMGQHAQARPAKEAPRRNFPSLAAAAENCSDSRVWSGAHFRAADEESRRLGRMIAGRATTAVPPVRGAHGLAWWPVVGGRRCRPCHSFQRRRWSVCTNMRRCWRRGRGTSTWFRPPTAR